MLRIQERFQEWREQRRSRRITYAGARARARRGAAYLDGADPAWFWRVDPETLDLSDGSGCILGQRHGSFGLGLSRALLVRASSAPRPGPSPVDLGFLCVRGVCEALQEQDYEYLNAAWQEEVRARQEADARRIERLIRSIELYEEQEEQRS